MKRSFQLLVNLLMVSALLLSACGKTTQTSETASGGSSAAAGDLKGTITISGAFALYPLMSRWAEEFRKVYPDVQFDISAGGAGKGMTDALSGAVDIGMVSRAIKPEEEQQGAYWVSVVKDAVFPVVNEKNPVLQDLLAKGVTREKFTKIYIAGEIKTWGELVGRPEVTDEIHVYTRSDAAGAPEVWAKYLGGAQEDLLGVGVSGDPGLLEAVVKDPLGIGFNNLGYAFELATGKPVAGAVIIPIDVNENGQADAEELLETMKEAAQMVAENKYPSPPARELNLVTKEKPEGLINAFILWILTDGQKFVGEAGYVELTPQKLTESLAKVK